MYRGVLTSGGWNRGIEVSSLQGVGIHFTGLEYDVLNSRSTLV